MNQTVLKWWNIPNGIKMVEYTSRRWTTTWTSPGRRSSGTEEPNPAVPYLHIQVDEPKLSLASDARKLARHHCINRMFVTDDYETLTKMGIYFPYIYSSLHQYQKNNTFGISYTI